MRCLVGVMAFALLAVGGPQAAWAASFISPTICTVQTSALETCDSAVGGLDLEYGGNTTRELLDAGNDGSGNPLNANTPLEVIVNGSAFDVTSGSQVTLGAGEMATVKLKIRNFDRNWVDLTGQLDSPTGPYFQPGVGRVAAFNYFNSNTAYTVPVAINVTGGLGLDVQVTDVDIVDQPERIGVETGTFFAYVDFTGHKASSIDSISLQDASMTVLDSTPTDEANKFALEDFLDQPGTPPLDLLTTMATGEMFLVLEDPGRPTSFDIEFKLSVPEVPLPAAAWLFLSGIGALLGFRRFRNQAA